MNSGLFRAASVRTRCAPFRCAGLSSDLCRVRDWVRVDVLVACRADDEGLAPHPCHEGGPRGCGPRTARPTACGAVGSAPYGDSWSGPGRGMDDRAPVVPEGDP